MGGCHPIDLSAFTEAAVQFTEKTLRTLLPKTQAVKVTDFITHTY